MRADAGEAVEQPGRARNLFQPDAVRDPVALPESGHEKRHFLQRRVPRPFSKPADRYFHVGGPRGHGGHRVGRGESQVIMAVHSDRGLRARTQERHEVFHQGRGVLRGEDPVRVGKVDHVGAGIPRCRAHAFQELGAGVRRLAEGELHPHSGRLRGAEAARYIPKRLVFLHLQHVSEKLRGHAHEDMEVGAAGFFQHLEGFLHVRGQRPGKRGDMGAVDLGAYPADALRLILRFRGEAGFDDVDAELFELPRKDHTVFR